MWPGYGENIRVLDWILRRCSDDLEISNIAVETPIGYIPKKGVYLFSMNTKKLLYKTQYI